MAVAGYNIYVDGVKVNTALVTTLSFGMTALATGTSQKVEVRAVDDVGNESASDTTQIKTFLTKPGTVTGATATGISSTQIDLSWTATTGAASYKIERSTDDITYAALASGVTTTTYSDTGLTGGTTYYYRLKATNATGDSLNYSAVVSAVAQSASIIESSMWWSRVDAGQGVTSAVSGADTLISAINDLANDEASFDLKQADALKQPKLVTGINGLPCIEISGSRAISSDAWSTGTTTSPLAKPLTRIVVIDFKTVAAAFKYALSFASSSARADFGQDNTGKLFIHSGATLTSTFTAAANTPYVVFIEFIGDGANDKIYVNGTLVATGNAGTQSLNAHVIGHIAAADVSAHAWIGESLVYKGTFTAADRDKITSELKTKYGIV